MSLLYVYIYPIQEEREPSSQRKDCLVQYNTNMYKGGQLDVIALRALPSLVLGLVSRGFERSLQLLKALC
jgi:hypothetical protein